MDEPCPFCEIVAGKASATIVAEWDDAIALVPLRPVVDGHLLVVPRQHASDFTSEADIAAKTMRRASELAKRTGGPMNLIASRGVEATQSVFHLHLHLVPRADNDGLALPWYSGRRRRG